VAKEERDVLKRENWEKGKKVKLRGICPIKIGAQGKNWGSKPS